MKNIKLIIVTAAILALFSACNFFEGTILEVELEEHESRLAPYAFFKDTDTILTVMVGKSVGVLDTINPDIVQFATVELYQNNNLLYVFEYTDSIKGYQIRLNEPFNMTEGDEYELRVSAQGFESTSAFQTVPKKVNLIEASWDYGGGITNTGQPADDIDIKFQDPANSVNYYTVTGQTNIFTLDPSDSTIVLETEQLPFILTSSDPSYVDNILSDFGFDGRVYTLKVQNILNVAFRNIGTVPDPNLDERYTGTIFFSSVTNEYATFVKSLTDFRNAQGNPFAEPVILYSNMSDGLGMFGLLSTETAELE